ncbi:MAG: DsrH/TusB family sulfur relay protein [Candidatus Thermoplasmatota archaeon]|nr:hypothetical protein [Euryarchaeota archaeon]MBU4032285.1 DsrH/TusB family sulfur relay protein [Candidatus Thermoplasmatota archaeon]MBU4072253.1 DsrH/TusB family sulfur relay protein [Candidatus Thermoplasmatota archaeon]MBU4144780.1 DsrH/TusB family sulfur relay protein [Candidatus Thermoplasmatota archaeon]MBU4591462.1 DsrH/TusB family sulfur relay protein [Candidatus Thermoplasmatota archaeon]
MGSKNGNIDIGLVITKSPFESPLLEASLKMLEDAIAQGHSGDIFLISDGVFLVKSGQKSRIANIFSKLLESCDIVIASKDHLMAAGISPEEMLENIEISESPYDDLVDQVMEKWEKVVSI